MSTSEIALLPCPFCGVKPLERFEKNPNGPKYPDHWFVWCENLDCKAGGEAMEETQEAARAAWNTRTPAQPAGEPVACSACGHVHPKNANCIGVAVGAGGGVVRLSPIATPPQAGPCPYAEDGKECILEAHSIGPCLCANPVTRSQAVIEREAALEAAAVDFIAKVDRGEAQSHKSYAAFKAALSLSRPERGDGG